MVGGRTQAGVHDSCFPNASSEGFAIALAHEISRKFPDKHREIFVNNWKSIFMTEKPENLTLCSPYRNFSNFDEDKLDKLYERLSNCGKDYAELVSPQMEIKYFPVYCE